MEINEFYKNLATKLTPANVNSKMKINVYFDAVELEWPVENQLTKTLVIRSDKNVKHRMCVDEIWTGEDSEGSPWSDHMGGLNIDCTGMDCQTAIDTIVRKIRNNYDLF